MAGTKGRLGRRAWCPHPGTAGQQGGAGPQTHTHTQQRDTRHTHSDAAPPPTHTHTATQHQTQDNTRDDTEGGKERRMRAGGRRGQVTRKEEVWRLEKMERRHRRRKVVVSFGRERSMASLELEQWRLHRHRGRNRVKLAQD